MKPPQEEPTAEKTSVNPAERVSVIVTNLIKLGGLIVALNEALVRSDLRPGGIALSALMMAGAQSLESFLTSFFGEKK